MIDYAQILATNYSGKVWCLVGNDYDGLEWSDESPKPTQVELDALWESTQAQVEADTQTKINAKQSALAKLAALGLTQDEVKAIIG